MKTRQKQSKLTRATLAEPLINAELFDAADKVEFLRWMKMESCPVPDTDDEINALLTRWIRHKRLERVAKVEG